MMESRVIRGWSTVAVDSVAGVLDSFMSGSFDSFFWSREFCVGVCMVGVDFLQEIDESCTVYILVVGTHE